MYRGNARPRHHHTRRLSFERLERRDLLATTVDVTLYYQGFATNAAGATAIDYLPIRGALVAAYLPGAAVNAWDQPNVGQLFTDDNGHVSIKLRKDYPQVQIDVWATSAPAGTGPGELVSAYEVGLGMSGANGAVIPQGDGVVGQNFGTVNLNPNGTIQAPQGDVAGVQTLTSPATGQQLTGLFVPLANQKTDASFSVFDALYVGGQYRTFLGEPVAGQPPPPAMPADAAQVLVVDPTVQGNGSYVQTPAGNLIVVPSTLAFSWTLVLHEYGHYTFGSIGAKGNGGKHHLTDNLTETLGAAKGLGVAFFEGAADFFAVEAEKYGTHES